MPKWWTFWGVIIAAVALAWLTSAPPAPSPDTAPATEFSAERAMAVVRDIGRAPHPIGSAEHDRVRDAVLARLQGLGAQAWTVTGSAVRKTDDGFVGADVENVVGVVPGKNRSLPAVLLMAHYDSVPGSPAAADDSAGVASILETVRALKARGQPARDLVVLITDGEEMGLFGAQSAFRDGLGSKFDIKRIGAVINLETRGSSGPAFMFETGERNAGVIGRYARSVANPAANSLTGWVYDRMPNGSDFTVPKEAGLPGVNIAMIGQPFDYHSASATPANLDPRSLQHMGDQSLVMAGAFLAEGPGARGPNLVYSDVFGRWLVSYPDWAGWLVIAGAALLIGLAMRREGLPERRSDLLRGAGLFLVLLAWPVLCLHLAYRLAPIGPEFFQSAMVAQFGIFFAGMALLATGLAFGAFGVAYRGMVRWAAVAAAIVAGLACSLRGGFDPVGAGMGVVAAILFAAVLGKPVEGRGISQGLLLAGLLVAIGLQATAPGIAFIVAWPVLGAALVAAVLAWGRAGPVRDVVAAVVAAVVLGWLLRLAPSLFDGLGMTNPELLGLFTAIGGIILAPFLIGWIAWGKGGHWTAAGCSLAGVGLLTFVALNSPWSARTPQPSHVMYVANQATGQARIVSVRDKLDPWSRSVLAGYGPVRDGPQPVLFAERAWWSEAGLSPRLGPDDYFAGWKFPASIEVSSPSGNGARTSPGGPAIMEPWIQGFAMRVPQATRDLRMTLTFSSPATVSTNASLSPEARASGGKPFRIRWYSGGDSQLEVVARPTAPHGSVRIEWAALRDGWPAGVKPLPPRPANVMATGSSDATVITGETTLRW